MRKINLEAERKFENKKTLDQNIRAAQSKYYWATNIDTNGHKLDTLKFITDKVVLEIGCSGGYDAINYASFANKYIGIDISDEAIRKAKKLNLINAKFICVEGTNYHFQINHLIAL